MGQMRSIPNEQQCEGGRGDNINITTQYFFVSTTKAMHDISQQQKYKVISVKFKIKHKYYITEGSNRLSTL